MKTSALPRLGLNNLGLGVGLRNKHFDYLLSNPPVVDWFEVISENYMDDYGYARSVLLKLRRGPIDAFSEIAQRALGIRVEPYAPVAAPQLVDRVLQAS